ncbi:MAG: efflux RND transporter periplasmic adaptor subunit [Phycisphaerales bacterium]
MKPLYVSLLIASGALVAGAVGYFLGRTTSGPAVALSPAPMEARTAADGTPMLQLSEHAAAMASVETVAIERRPLSRDLRVLGMVEQNESSLATITPRVDGYVERLFVNFTGVEIRAGDHLAEVYSPELLVAQQELLIALQGGAAGPLVDVSKTKLRLLGLSDAQVGALVERKQTTDRVTLLSPINGTVIEKAIVERAAFKAGDVLFRIANLDSVWVYLEIYEYDLPWVRYGQNVRLTAEAVPGRTFDGLVTFVQPLVNDRTRTVRVPVHVDNKDHALKPGMFVTALIGAALTSQGRAAPTGVEGRYSCPMHPQILLDAPGPCPVCQMRLERIPGERPKAEDAAAATQDRGGGVAAAEKLGVLAVPVSAVLDSGTRRIAYVEKGRGLYSPRELTLGPRAGAYFPVLAGLELGERVVARGNFLIDSQFQVEGQSSLFYPGGLHAAMGHQHGAAKPATSPPRGKSAPAEARPAEHKH